MKRREFLKKTSAIGLTGLSGQGCSSSIKNAARTTGPGFDIHPFIKNHPDAVFIARTSIKSISDSAEIRKAGSKLAQELIVKTKSGGYPNSTLVSIKDNWHGKKELEELYAMNTDPNFSAAWIESMKEIGPQKFFMERPQDHESYFSESGYASLIKKNRTNFMKIPDGIVFDTMKQTSFFNDPDVFLVNIAKIKAHSMGITASIKNLQGCCVESFRQFCLHHMNVRKSLKKKNYDRHLLKNFETHIEELYARHVKQGIPRWDKPGTGGGIWQEQWSQRMIDSFSVTPTNLNVVEGIYAIDGNGFGAGPHEKSPAGYSHRNYMSNVVVFGIDPFRVDNIIHLMCGHEPGNFGLFHIGIERGVSNVLDPGDIPVYFWENGQAALTSLDKLPVTPLRTLFLQRDYNGQNEPNYHLCNEPFDYSAWKKGKRTGSAPSIKELGRDSDDNIVMEVSLPKREHVYVDILDRDGDIVGRLLADGELEPGSHQVVWDGFASPGIYNVYFKGMGWDATKQIVTYS